MKKESLAEDRKLEWDESLNERRKFGLGEKSWKRIEILNGERKIG